MASYCDHCGVQLNEGAQFCHSCQKPLKAGHVGMSGYTSSIFQSTPQPEPQPKADAPSAAKRAAKCVVCGNDIENGRGHASDCSTKEAGESAQTTTPKHDGGATKPISTYGSSRSAFADRYRDLYRTARLINGVGTLWKVLAFIFGGVIFLFWFFVGIGAASLGPQGPSNSAGATAFLVCLVMGAVTGGVTTALIFLLGIVISAQGQLLKAQADVAVHSSPFLTDDERASVMSLPYPAPKEQIVGSGERV